VSRQLIYTSAPEGLKRGSSGFCTVAADGGMSPPLMTKLELLSGYEFRYNLSDPNSDQNPVSFCHTRIDLGGRTAHVLSRVAFCGADYSGRTNKIAHHFLLEDGELLPCGPAEMIRRMDAKGLFCLNWDTGPRSLEATDLTEPLSDSMDSDEPPRQWANHGDAGWGGVLARAFCRSKKIPSYLIFEPGADLLPLFGESLQVLPSKMRWNVDFATYYTSSPPNCHYHWRGILAGSTAMKEAGRFPNAVKLDLTGPLGTVPESDEDEFTKAARQGQVAPSLKERPTAVAGGRGAGRRVGQAVEPSKLALDEATRAASESATACRSEADRWNPRVVHRARIPWSKWALVLSFAALFAVVVAGGMWLWLNQSNGNTGRDALFGRGGDQSSPVGDNTGRATENQPAEGNSETPQRSEEGTSDDQAGDDSNAPTDADEASDEGHQHEQADEQEPAETNHAPVSPVHGLEARLDSPLTVRLTWKWKQDVADPNAKLTLQRKAVGDNWTNIHSIESGQRQYRDHGLSEGKYEYRIIAQKAERPFKDTVEAVTVPRMNEVLIPQVRWPQDQEVSKTIWLSTEMMPDGAVFAFPEEMTEDGEYKLVSVADWIKESLPVTLAVGGDAKDENKGKYISIMSRTPKKELLRAYIKWAPGQKKLWLVCDPNDEAWRDQKLRSKMRYCTIRIRSRAAGKILQFALRQKEKKLKDEQVKCGWSEEGGAALLKCAVGGYPWPKSLTLAVAGDSSSPTWYPRMSLGKEKVDTSFDVETSEGQSRLDFKHLNDRVGKWGRLLNEQKELRRKIESLNGKLRKVECDLDKVKKDGRRKEKQLKESDDKDKSRAKEVKKLKELKENENEKESEKEDILGQIQKAKREYQGLSVKAAQARSRLRELAKVLDGQIFTVEGPWSLPVARFKISCSTPPKQEQESDQ
jgi:hypothetical protein